MSNKNILIVSPAPTHPSYAGNRSCILSYANMLKELGYTVKFLLIANQQDLEEETELTKEYWGENFYLFKKNQGHRVIEYFLKITRFKRTGYYKVDDFYPYGLKKYMQNLQRENQFKCIIVNYIFLSKICTFFDSVKTLLYTHDVFTNQYQRTGIKWFSVRANDEAVALERADKVLAIQEQEADFYKYLTNKPVLTTYSYFPETETPFTGKKVLLYLAGPNKHNLDSITAFVKTTFLKLLEVHEDLLLIIGGQICDILNNQFKHKNILINGQVENLEHFYSQGDIFLNPTLRGTGLKIKNFEAMSFGKILLCHPHNTIGIYNKASAPILIAENADEYNIHLNILFNNKNKAAKLKEESIKYIRCLNEVVKNTFIEAIEHH